MFSTYIVLSGLISLLVNANDDVVLKAENLGTLIGSQTKTEWTHQKIYQLLGIPFAEPPSGLKRFKPAVPVEKWPIVQNVQKHGRPCPVLKYLQNMLPNELEGDLEDCLHISIYTKDFYAKNPVMFYIHGGAFEEGGAFQFPPNYLLEKDIVLVVPQYRLGPFGFLSTLTDEIPGSAALSDLLLALNWTNKFISNFGGDPSCVTIFGHSAGGGLASALLLSPEVPEGLFHRAVVQSGSMFSTRAFDMTPVRNAKDMAGYYCDQLNTIDEINECLIKMDVMDLLRAYDKHAKKTKFNLGLDEFGGGKLTFNPILPKTPSELITNGKIKNIPVMAGVTKHDGSFIFAMVKNWLKEKYGENYRNINIYPHFDEIIKFLGLKEQTGLLTGLSANEFFTEDQLLHGKIDDLIEQLIDISGDITLKAPLFKVAQTQAKRYPNQTYLYTFDFHGEFPYLEDMDFFANFNGVHHYSDVLRLFPITFFGTVTHQEDINISRKMINLWTSFAKTGIPISEDVPQWPSLSKYIGPYLHINTKSTIATNFLEEFSIATKEVLIKENEHCAFKP